MEGKKCQCCGNPVEGFGDVCVVCGWEQVDPWEVENEEEYVDANYCSLRYYRNKFLEVKTNGKSD